MSLAVLPDSCSICSSSPDKGSPDKVSESNKTGNTRFTREARLLTAADYSCVFKRNKRFADQYWTVLVHRCDDTPARLGLAIAKKRAKRAVDRNKIKRIAREAFRQKRLHLHGVELVVMNRDAAASADTATLRQAIDKLLGKIEKSNLALG